MLASSNLLAVLPAADKPRHCYVVCQGAQVNTRRGMFARVFWACNPHRTRIETLREGTCLLRQLAGGHHYLVSVEELRPAWAQREF